MGGEKIENREQNEKEAATQKRQREPRRDGGRAENMRERQEWKRKEMIQAQGVSQDDVLQLRNGQD